MDARRVIPIRGDTPGGFSGLPPSRSPPPAPGRSSRAGTSPPDALLSRRCSLPASTVPAPTLLESAPRFKPNRWRWGRCGLCCSPRPAATARQGRRRSARRSRGTGSGDRAIAPSSFPPPAPGRNPRRPLPVGGPAVRLPGDRARDRDPKKMFNRVRSIRYDLEYYRAFC